MRILFLEDDAKLADYVIRGLQRDGHTIEHFADGREGLIAAIDRPFDVAILDRMLPGLDGLSVVKAMRSSEISTPVLFLTSMVGINDRVSGLKAGGDDYLVKPFALAELSARVEALGRRPATRGEEAVLRVGDLEMNLIDRTVRRGSTPIELLHREFVLLEFLMRTSGKAVTRAMLLERVWDLDFDPKTSVVETHLSRLRAKVDKPFGKPLIHTIRGIGYSLHAPV
jgi:two-component system OmpR family response regulator